MTFSDRYSGLSQGDVDGFHDNHLGMGGTQDFSGDDYADIPDSFRYASDVELRTVIISRSGMATMGNITAEKAVNFAARELRRRGLS